MHYFTEKLPLVKEFEMNELIGKTTKEAMKTGVIIGIYEEMLQQQNKC